jgi:esterase/lipase superfamily enzyme
MTLPLPEGPKETPNAASNSSCTDDPPAVRVSGPTATTAEATVNREYHQWESPALGRTMQLLVFGHGGAPVLVFPTSMGRFNQWEDFGMVQALAHYLDQGWAQLFCVDSVDSESWYNHAVPVAVRGARHNQYERYVLDEVLPFIKGRNPTPYLISAGCSFGAYHAANFSFKHPELVNRCLAISGAYDLHFLLDGQYDDGCYFNSPVDYLPNLSDDRYLRRYSGEGMNMILVVGGSGDICYDGTHRLADILAAKGIPHTLDVWDPAWHDWPWWKQMIVKHL